jgi:hypothetical protein
MQEMKLDEDAQHLCATRDCEPTNDQVIADVVRQSGRQKARKCRVPFLSIVLVRRISGNTAWRLTDTIIAERSVRTLWQSGSPKRLRLGLTLTLRQVAESVRLGVEDPEELMLNWHHARYQKTFVIQQDGKQMRCESIDFPRAQLLNVARQEETLRRHEMAGAGERLAELKMVVEGLTGCEFD